MLSSWVAIFNVPECIYVLAVIRPLLPVNHDIVKVSSDPADPTVVSWWRCGESLRPLPGHREMISHEDGWHELILSNVTEEDEGEYECRAENHRGHNSSFGSLFYYQEGGGTLTDVTLEGMATEGTCGQIRDLLHDGQSKGTQDGTIVEKIVTSYDIHA
ncbi:ig-like domain-containing protein [Trichonephila clavipes]|nr:ig-like domain-containing protein [Trichonephila clavipes]